MKKLIHFITRIVCIFTLFFSTSFMQAMNKNYKQQDSQIKEYNPNNPLLLEDTVRCIFSHCPIKDKNQIFALQSSIKTLMKLSTTCKKFNALLTVETIGNFCKNYSKDSKNKTVKRLRKLTYIRNDKVQRPLIILIHAGANPNIIVDFNSLLEDAILYDDIQLVVALFKHHVNPNKKNIIGDPFFFNVRKIEIANIFINHKDFNVHAINKRRNTNVLWRIIDNTFPFPSELINLYLTHGVDAKNIDSFSQSCLLHELATDINNIENVNDFLKKCQLFLDAIPTMINTLNKHGQTPLDIAQISHENKINQTQINLKENDLKASKQLIKLYRSRGALTAQELNQQTNQPCSCIII